MDRIGLAVMGALMIVAIAGPALGEMKVGVRDGYLEGMNAETVWAAARAVGLPLLEVAVTRDLACDRLFEGKEKPYRIDTPENRAKLAAAVKKNECEIIGFCAVVPFAKDGNEDWAVEWIGNVAEAAAEMKVPLVYMPLGGWELSEEQFVERATAFLKRVAPIARKTKVQLAIENLGPYLNKPEVLASLLMAVPTDEVALMYDPANMYWFGYPRDRIYELVRIFAPFTRMLHAKNVKYPEDKRDVRREMGWEYAKYAEPVPTGDLDFARIVGILVKSGFKGNIVIEDDSLPKKDAAGKKKALQDDAKALRDLAGAQSKPASGDSAKPRVEFETSMGSFVVELTPDKTPITVQNFLRYVDEGYYDGTIFHRVIPTFMIQGGGFTGIERQKFTGLHEPIKNEAKIGLKNKRGTIAMARTPDPHSATSQFFVNVADNDFLDAPGQDGWGYCAFGTVVSGMDVVDKLKSVPTSPMGERSQPVDPPVIQKARRAN